MKYSATILQLLLDLVNGDTVADSKLKGDLFKNLKEDKHLIAITHGSRKSWRAQNCKSLRFILRDEHDLRDLEGCLRIAQSNSNSRASMVQTTGDSKFKSISSFKGFMVNCYQQIEARLNDQQLILHPQPGTFTFIYDFENFQIPDDVIIVGIENPENFRHIAGQEIFFAENISSSASLLFVSRYPQTQHCALIKWLKSVSNRYVHFGDLDLAGINIYLTEYFPHLGERSSFLIPLDFDERIAAGSFDRYNTQLRFANIVNSVNKDIRLLPLIESIHRHHRGYDQEGFITPYDLTADKPDDQTT